MPRDFDDQIPPTRLPKAPTSSRQGMQEIGDAVRKVSDLQLSERARGAIKPQRGLRRDERQMTNYKRGISR